MKGKDRIQQKYLQYISSLNKLKDSLENLSGGQNSQFTEIQRGFIQAFEEEILFSSREMENSLNGTVWDKLTIAFFGETNAGKSTIIETFRILYDKNRRANNDGNIVGDGRSDFTQSYEEYDLEIEGRPFTLIDVPGIEGNEKVYADGIKKALRRAHIVFYVHGHNIKPNIATAEKIKEYLGDWVNVYTLYNVRGSVSDYDEDEERINLYTDKIKERETLIVSTFKDVLGDVYKGNITLQALLAMCAYANFAPERDDLKNKQDKLLRFFDTPDNLLNFSKFQLVQELVRSKSANYLDEIISANEQKMHSMARKAEAHLETTANSLSEKSMNFEKSLKNFKHDVSEAFSSCKRSIGTNMRAQVDRRTGYLRERIDRIIDDKMKDKEKRAQNAYLEEMRCLSRSLEETVEKGIKSLQEKIEKKKHKLDAEYGSKITISNPRGDIGSNLPLAEAMGKLDISLGDCLDFAGSVISGALAGSSFTWIVPGVATAIGAAIGAASYGIRKLIFSDGGKSKAKEEVRNSISKARKELLTKVEERIRILNLSLDRKRNEINIVIDRELKDLNNIAKTIDKAKSQITFFAINTKHS